MIFDRTISDVKQAESIRKNKVQKGLTLSEQEKEILKRGTLSFSTLNRIEYKQAELSSIMRGMGYYVVINNKEWSRNSIFTDADLIRIVENNKALRNAFYTYADTPLNAVARYHYEEFNSLEKILYDLENMIDYTQNHYRRCGTFECGG